MTPTDRKTLIATAGDLAGILDRCADGGYTLARIKAECANAVTMLSRLTTALALTDAQGEDAVLVGHLRDWENWLAGVLVERPNFVLTKLLGEAADTIERRAPAPVLDREAVRQAARAHHEALREHDGHGIPWDEMTDERQSRRLIAMQAALARPSAAPEGWVLDDAAVEAMARAFIKAAGDDAGDALGKLWMELRAELLPSSPGDPQ